jgi:hypothetical protein
MADAPVAEVPLKPQKKPRSDAQILQLQAARQKALELRARVKEAPKEPPPETPPPPPEETSPEEEQEDVIYERVKKERKKKPPKKRVVVVEESSDEEEEIEVRLPRAKRAVPPPPDPKLERLMSKMFAY